MSDLSMFLWALRVRRNYRAIGAALLALGFVAGLIAGCAMPAWRRRPAPLHKPWARELLIDERFDDDERAMLIYGFEGWPALAGDSNVALTYGLVAHDLAEAPGTPSSLHVIRFDQRAEGSPCGGDAVGCWDRDRAHVLIAAGAIAGGLKLARVAGHELGHAMGLPDRYFDRSGTRIMEYRVDLMADRASIGDVVAFCDLNGCE